MFGGRARRRYLFAAISGVLFVAAAGLITYRPRPAQLFDRARRTGIGQNYVVIWQDDHTILRIPTVTIGPGAIRILHRIEPFDLTTHAATESPWTDVYRKFGQRSHGLQLSPDRQRALFIRYIGGNRSNSSERLIVCNRAGVLLSDRTYPSITINGGPHWLPDSKRLVLFEEPWNRGYIDGTLFDTDTGRSARLSVPPNVPYFAGAEPDGKILFTDYSGADNMGRPVTFDEYASIEAVQRGAHTRRSVVRVPKDDMLIDMMPSPQCDRILWSTLTPVKQFGDPWLPRLLPSLGQFYAKSYALVISLSRTDGSEMHEIARYTGDLVHNQPSGIHWLPGGKAAAFYYAGDLWTFPVE